MKRKMIPEVVERWSPYELDGELIDLITKLKSMEDRYEQQGSIQVDAEWCDYDQVDITFTLMREETDAEFEKRKRKSAKAAATRKRNKERKLALEAAEAAQKEEQERALYEQLKAKFDSA